MTIFSRTALAVFAALSLAACEQLKTFVPPPPPPQPVVSEPDAVTLRLVEAADKVSASLDTLAQVEQARTPLPAPPLPDSLPPELARTVTVTWVGPVEPLAARLAARAGYTFSRIGNPPNVPVIVNVEAIDRPVFEVLRDVGLQAGRQADLGLDAARRVVEIRYVPPGQ